MKGARGGREGGTGGGSGGGRLDSGIAVFRDFAGRLGRAGEGRREVVGGRAGSEGAGGEKCVISVSKVCQVEQNGGAGEEG